MRMRTPLATIGNVNVDLIMGVLAPWPETGSEVICPNSELRVGGAAGNVALAWQAMGLHFQCAASTGSDHFGDWLRGTFGPIAKNWARSSSSTTISVGVTHPDDERTFLSTLGHLPEFSWSDVESQIDWEGLRGGTLILCGCFLTKCLSAQYDRLFARAAASDIDIALDTGWPVEGWTSQSRTLALGWLSQSKIALLNSVEATSLTATDTPQTALDALIRHMPSDAIAVIKLGPDGAMAQHRGQTLHVRAPKVAVEDTIGAGDVFNAAFIAALSQHHCLQNALEQAVATASHAISTTPRSYIRQETL